MEIKENSAILLGNGINLYVADKSETEKKDWKTLLKLPKAGTGIEKTIFDSEFITYPEIYNVLAQNPVNSKKNIKYEIAEEIKKWKQSEFHKDFFSFAREKNIPILTTNYDNTLLGNDSSVSKCNKSKVYYFSENPTNDVLNSFSVWFVHGLCTKPESIVIGLDDYANNLSKINKILFDKSSERLIVSSNSEWKGKNTWLDIFFHKNLYIIGLELGPQEIDLRWLLMERSKYIKENGLELLTFYVDVDSANKNKTENDIERTLNPIDGKKAFFKAFNIKPEIKLDYDEIYESWGIE